MKPRVWLAIFATCLCSGTIAVLSAAPVGAAPSADRTAQVAKTPKPPRPLVVTVDPTKDGAIVKGSTKVNSRLTKSGRSPKPKKRKHSQSKKVNYDGPASQEGRNLTAPLKRDDFRLNNGICQLMGPDGTFPGPTRCRPTGPDKPAEPVEPTTGVVAVRLPQPQDVRWEQIYSQYKNVLFPGLGVKVQPAGRTLVNLDTIVYTDQSKISVSTVSLLGFPVVVEATPMRYTWRFGDGATLTTSSPGRPYPAKDITHKYLKRGGVNVSLTTHYAARFNVAGTGWQYVSGTVPITGPATTLLIREAVPVLVDPPR